MCDEHTVAAAERHLRRMGLSRRRFGALTAGAAVAALLPRPANALDVVEHDVVVQTPDGAADCYFVHPATGRHPGVLVWPDIIGLRPTFRAMGRRLAQSGYAVLVVNPFYRSATAPVAPDGSSFQDAAVRERILPFARQLSVATYRTDAAAFVTFLDGQAAVDPGRGIGTMGYCMGGPMAVHTAVVAPDRVGAVATFHGARMVTEDANSPHRVVAGTRARYLIAIAANDDDQQPNAKDALRKSFAAAGLTAEVDVYAGTIHGWCPPDNPVHDPAQAERAWARLLALFGAALA